MLWVRETFRNVRLKMRILWFFRCFFVAPFLIHATGIFYLYIYHTNQPNVGKTSGSSKCFWVKFVPNFTPKKTYQKADKKHISRRSRYSIPMEHIFGRSNHRGFMIPEANKNSTSCLQVACKWRHPGDPQHLGLIWIDTNSEINRMSRIKAEPMSWKMMITRWLTRFDVIISR